MNVSAVCVCVCVCVSIIRVCRRGAEIGCFEGRSLEFLAPRSAIGQGQSAVGSYTYKGLSERSVPRI